MVEMGSGVEVHIEVDATTGFCRLIKGKWDKNLNTGKTQYFKGKLLGKLSWSAVITHQVTQEM